MKTILIGLSLAITTIGYSSEQPPQRPDTPFFTLPPLPSGDTPKLPSPTHLMIRDGKLVDDDRMGQVKVRPLLLRSFREEYEAEIVKEVPERWASFVESCLQTATLKSLEDESPSDISVSYECEIWSISLSQWKKAIVLAIAIKRQDTEE